MFATRYRTSANCVDKIRIAPRASIAKADSTIVCRVSAKCLPLLYGHVKVWTLVMKRRSRVPSVKRIATVVRGTFASIQGTAMRKRNNASVMSLFPIAHSKTWCVIPPNARVLNVIWIVIVNRKTISFACLKRNVRLNTASGMAQRYVRHMMRMVIG